MSELSIAQQIANKRLYRRKLVKLAQGHQPGLRPAPRSNSSSSSGVLGNIASTGATAAKNTLSGVWNYGGKQLLNTGANTLSGIGTTATGVANFGAGGLGAIGGLAARGVGEATDALGLTDSWGAGAKDFQDSMNEAMSAGLQNTFGGAADTLSLGYYDYDGSASTNPTATPRTTAVDRMRSKHRDLLGRDSYWTTAYNTLNTVGDFAANTAAQGGAGRGLNMAAQGLKAAPAMQAARQAASAVPIAGRPAAAVGNWLAGPAPTYNMFTQTLPQYARSQVGNATGRFAQTRNAAQALSNEGLGLYGEYLAVNQDIPHEMRVQDDLQKLQGQYELSLSSAHLDEESYAQLTALADSLNGKTPEEQIPLFQRMNAIVADNSLQNDGTLPAAATSTPEAPSSNLTEGPPVAPANPQTLDDIVSQSLSPDASEEDAALVQKVVQNLATAQDKPQTPEDAAALVENSEGSSIERLAQERAQENPPPTDNPRDWGQWFEETMSWATEAWNNLGFVGKLAFGLGMPLGVIGLLGGGLSGVLTAALGFGVAGLAAAGSGALGETAQGAVTAAGETITGTGAPAAPAEPPTPLAQDESLKLVQELTAAPNGAQYIAQNRDKFNQFAAMSDADLSSVTQQMTPESRATVNKILTELKTQVDDGIKEKGAYPDWLADTWAAEKLRRVGLKSTSELPALQEKINRMLQILNAAPTGEKNSMLNSKSASHIVAQHLAITTLQKAARCWSGYEPVPGKKPYSNDSCRPISGKKKKKKDKAAK